MLLCSQVIANSAHAVQNGSSLTIGIQKPLYNYQATIHAERTDHLTRWFDDHPSHDETVVTELGLQLPGKSTIRYRNYSLQGRNRGEASKYSCKGILGCFWISGSILDGLSSNDSIAYRVENNELWMERPYQLHQPFTATVAPLVGINIVPASLSVQGAGEQKLKQSTLPIPFYGLRLSVPLSKQLTITSEIHHLDYDNGRWGLRFQNLQASFETPVTHRTKLSLGYMSYHLNLRYHHNNTKAHLDLPLNTPFIKLTTRF